MASRVSAGGRHRRRSLRYVTTVLSLAFTTPLYVKSGAERGRFRKNLLPASDGAFKPLPGRRSLTV